MKKVKCINNERCKDGLTVGKIYETFDEDLVYCTVLEDDAGNETSYYRRRFQEINTYKIYELWM